MEWLGLELVSAHTRHRHDGQRLDPLCQDIGPLVYFLETDHSLPFGLIQVMAAEMEADKHRLALPSSPSLHVEGLHCRMKEETKVFPAIKAKTHSSYGVPL